MSGKIIYKPSDTYSLKIEKNRELENSYFFNEYKRILGSVNEIIKAKDIKKDKRVNRQSEKTCKDYNNIIAIIGDRGSGKSSVTASIIDILEGVSKDSEEREWYRKIIPMQSEIWETEFHVMPMIDPTGFVDNDSIIKIVVSELFKEYKKYLEDKTEVIENQLGEHQKLLKCFKEVYRNLRWLAQDEKGIFDEGQDELEVLVELSSSLQLKKNLNRLIECYIEMITILDRKYNVYHQRSKRYLVIPIDDMDMNITYAYKMVEDIRRYLQQDNVIILMNYKHGQLGDIIDQNYMKEYSSKIQEKSFYFKEVDMFTKAEIKSKNEKDISKVELSDWFELTNKIKVMSNEYMKKLVPIGRRTKLNNVSYEDISCEVYNSEKQELEEKTCVEYFEDNFKRKFGMNIQNSTYKILDFLLPQNLRGKLNFLHMIEQYTEAEEDQSMMQKNIEDLLDYMLVEWCEEKLLDSKFIEYLKEVREQGIEATYIQLMQMLRDELLHVGEELEQQPDKREMVNANNIEAKYIHLSIVRTLSIKIADSIVQYKCIKKINTIKLMGDMLTLFAILEDYSSSKTLGGLTFNELKFIFALIVNAVKLNGQDEIISNKQQETNSKDMLGLLPLYEASKENDHNKYLYNLDEINLARLTTSAIGLSESEKIFHEFRECIDKNSEIYYMDLRDEEEIDKYLEDYYERTDSIYMNHLLLDQDWTYCIRKNVKKQEAFVKNILEPAKCFDIVRLRERIFYTYRRDWVKLDENEGLPVRRRFREYLKVGGYEQPSRRDLWVMRSQMNLRELGALRMESRVRYKSCKRESIKEIYNEIENYYMLEENLVELGVFKNALKQYIEDIQRQIQTGASENKEGSELVRNTVMSLNRMLFGVRLNSRLRKQDIDFSLEECKSIVERDQHILRREMYRAKHMQESKIEDLLAFFTNDVYKPVLGRMLQLEKLVSGANELSYLSRKLSTEVLEKYIQEEKVLDELLVLVQ